MKTSANGTRAAPAGATLHVTVQNRSGSVQHYYHFLLGFFVPLVHELSTSWADRRIDHVLVRSCGPFDHLIAELGDPRIRVIDPKEHRRMRETPLEVATIPGLDDPVAYDDRTFGSVRGVLRRLPEIQDELQRVESEWPRGDARVLVIERGPGHVFYGSEQSETKTAGSERRSIPNFSDVHESLRRDHPACLAVMPETLSLAQQLALFAAADVIVAQHGAALANVIWARPGATVVEIFPDDVRADFFRDLTSCVGLRYRRVRQEHSHAAVDPDAVRAVVREAVERPDRVLACRARRVVFRVRRVTKRIAFRR